jgi:hypothetical protein
MRLGHSGGTGLTIRAGKFVTLLGYETINRRPTRSIHSIEFGYGIPFTHTGVLGIYSFTDKLTVTFGGTRGWEQSLKDNNSSLDALGQVKYVFSDKITGYFNFVTGPEETDNDSLWRTVFDGVVVYSATDRLASRSIPALALSRCGNCGAGGTVVRRGGVYGVQAQRHVQRQPAANGSPTRKARGFGTMSTKSPRPRHQALPQPRHRPEPGHSA